MTGLPFVTSLNCFMKQSSLLAWDDGHRTDNRIKARDSMSWDEFPPSWQDGTSNHELALHLGYLVKPHTHTHSIYEGC